MAELNEIASRYRKEVERATGWDCKGVMLSDFGKVPELVFLSPGWSEGTEMDDNARRVNPVAQAKHEAFEKVKGRFERVYREFNFGVAGYVRGQKVAGVLIGTDERIEVPDFEDLKSFVLSFSERKKVEEKNYDEAVKWLSDPVKASRVDLVLKEAKRREGEIRTTLRQWKVMGTMPKSLKEGFEVDLARLPHQIRGLERALREFKGKSVKGVDMNRNMVAKELLAIAEELMGVPAPAAQEDDPWMTKEQVAEVCPACSQLMASKGLKRVRASVLKGKSVRKAG